MILKPRICVRKHISLVLALLKKIAGATKANVVVRISRRVIQFRCERPGVTRVIPIATADEGVLRF